MKLQQGMVQVYFGSGKGKTSAALGAALRASGYGLRSYVIQFMKKQATGETVAAKKMKPPIGIEQFGKKSFVAEEKISLRDKREAHQALDKAKKIILDGKYSLVVLDEVGTALSYGLIDAKQLLQLIGEKPRNKELVLTGIKFPSEIVKCADLVTEMKKVKHPYDKGIKARRGIDY